MAKVTKFYRAEFTLSVFMLVSIIPHPNILLCLSRRGSADALRLKTKTLSMMSPAFLLVEFGTLSLPCLLSTYLVVSTPATDFIGSKLTLSRICYDLVRA